MDTSELGHPATPIRTKSIHKLNTVLPFYILFFSVADTEVFGTNNDYEKVFGIKLEFTNSSNISISIREKEDKDSEEEDDA